jgi:hypothetical protein
MGRELSLAMRRLARVLSPASGLRPETAGTLLPFSKDYFGDPFVATALRASGDTSAVSSLPVSLTSWSTNWLLGGGSRMWRVLVFFALAVDRNP